MKKLELSSKKPYTKPTLTKHKTLRDITAMPIGSPAPRLHTYRERHHATTGHG